MRADVGRFDAVAQGPVYRAGCNCEYCLPRPCTYNVETTSRPSIAEQMGSDPISKLAVAIHDLADAMRKAGDERLDDRAPKISFEALAAIEPHLAEIQAAIEHEDPATFRPLSEFRAKVRAKIDGGSAG